MIIVMDVVKGMVMVFVMVMILVMVLISVMVMVMGMGYGYHSCPYKLTHLHIGIYIH